MRFRYRMRCSIADAFFDDHDFLKALQRSVESCINKNPRKTAELLAKFVNRYMKSGSCPDIAPMHSNVDGALESIMSLFSRLPR